MTENKDRSNTFYSIRIRSASEGGRALEIAGRIGEVYCKPGDVLVVSHRQLLALKEAKVKFEPARIKELE